MANAPERLSARVTPLSKRLTAAAMLVGLATASACNDPASSPTSVDPERLRSAPRLGHEGGTYTVLDGDLYRLRDNGGAEFVDRLYDPGFFARNYERRGARLFQKDPDSDEAYPVTRSFRDGFEGVDSVESLIGPARWHQFNTDPRRAGEEHNFYELGNRISISRDVVRSGDASLRFHALPSRAHASKASITKGILYYEKGDDVWFSGWFFIEDTPSLVDAGAFTLVDLESSFLRYAGLRVIFRRNDSLAFELKFPKTQFEQQRGAEVAFPTGRWVHVRTHAFLSDEDGRVRIWQDGHKVLDSRGRTLPLADTVYDSLELGITVIAKASRYEKVLYVDDVVISDSRIDE